MRIPPQHMSRIKMIALDPTQQVPAIGDKRTRSTWIAVAVIALAVSALMLPALFRPMMMHDSFWIDHVWASQFTALLGEGVLYPRWLPWSHQGLGSPVFYYYPPLAFYVSGLFGLLGLSTYGSILATFALGFFVSGIGTWLWLRNRTDYPLLGALFFTLAPYHVVDFYTRGAQAESIAIAVLPWLAIGLRRTAEGKGWRFAAVTYALIIIGHLPMALLASVFLVAPYALLHRRQLPSFALACATGIGLAAIYLVPALGLADFRETAQLWGTSFLKPSFWTLPAGNWHVPFVIYFHLNVAALAIPALLIAFMTRDRWAIYSVGILAIALGLVPYLWSLPLLRNVQFAYRILPLAELGLAAAIASRTQIGLALRFALMLLPLAYSAAMVKLDRGKGHDRFPVEHHIHDVTEYLPPGTQDPATMGVWLERPLEGRSPPPKVERWIVQPVFYFPSWSCGQPEPKTKLLMHRPGCVPEIQPTIYEKIGGLISLFFLLVLLLGRPIVRKFQLAGMAPRSFFRSV